MFKKPAEVKSQQRLSGADRKKFKKTIKDQFSNASNDDIDVLLPPKTEILVSKLENRVIVYRVEGGPPMFFDIDGRGSNIFPTVFSLWQLPELLPFFILKAGAVSRYIIGGADLMFPGIMLHVEGAIQSFAAGETWAVKVPGNPAPIAVGITTMSTDEALKANFRGKALRITHFYRDLLWSSAEGNHIPNSGFFEDIVLADPCLSACEIESSPRSVDKLDYVVGEVCGSDESVDVSPECNTTSTQAGNVFDFVESVASRIDDIDMAEKAHVDHHHNLSSDDIEELLDKCLLQALHSTVKDKDLPMLGSILWTNHILPSRPTGVVLDMRKSSYKKLSKWLQSKSSIGIICVKEDKHKKEAILVSVNRNHEAYKSFKPNRFQSEKASQESSDVVKNDTSHKPLEVEEVYKPSVHVAPIFLAMGADAGKFYSASEASSVAFSYVEKHNLIKESNKAIVVLDATLCDVLFKGAIKKGSMYPEEIHKKDLGLAFLNRMQTYHRIARGTKSVTHKGRLKTVQIVTERRQGNKKVTKLSGLEAFLVDPELIAAELQKKFACSTSMAELPGKKGKEILVQGGVMHDLGNYLVQHHSIPKNHIQVLDKTKK